MNFTFEEESFVNSPYIEKVWRTRSDHASEFTSLAASHSEIVITKFEGQTTISVRGPETKASIASVPGDAEFMGIVFKLGTFMPNLLPKNLMDRRDVHLPIVNNQAFWLDGSPWEIPNLDNADTFVARLMRDGLLAHDPVVGAVMQGEPLAYSPRALQYRFVRATGLPHKAIQQIERARQALLLLQRGKPIANTAYEVGYFDQSHLTNAFKRFLGLTPSQIVRTSPPE